MVVERFTDGQLKPQPELKPQPVPEAIEEDEVARFIRENPLMDGEKGTILKSPTKLAKKPPKMLRQLSSYNNGKDTENITGKKRRGSDETADVGISKRWK